MTQLVCSDWHCRRTTVNSFRDDRDWKEKRDGKVQPKASLKNILCNVHAGAMKRSKYQDNPLPLTEADRERLLKEQAKVDSVKAAEARVRQAENEAATERRRREEWANQTLPAGHALSEDTDRSTSAREEPVFEGFVWLGQQRRGQMWDRWLRLQPSTRHYQKPPEGQEYPYVISITRGASLTPNEARELAALLVESAAKAEELNDGKAPA